MLFVSTKSIEDSSCSRWHSQPSTSHRRRPAIKARVSASFACVGRVPADQKRRSRGDRRHEKQTRCFEDGLGFTSREPPGVTEVLGPVRCAEVLCLWFQDGGPIEKHGNLLTLVQSSTGTEEYSVCISLDEPPNRLQEAQDRQRTEHVAALTRPIGAVSDPPSDHDNEGHGSWSRKLPASSRVRRRTMRSRCRAPPSRASGSSGRGRIARLCSALHLSSTAIAKCQDPISDRSGGKHR